MSTLVIVASGASTRLQEIHQDLYPKLLINVGQQLFIDRLIESYTSNISIKDIIIIVNSSQAIDQIKESYVDITSNQLAKNIKFIVFNEQIGTAKTLKRCIYDNHEVPNTNLLVVWSDIYPTNIKTPSVFSDDFDGTIYIDSNPVHRIDFNLTTLNKSQDAKGNVPGLFYFKDIGKIFRQTGIDLDIEHENEIDITAVLKDVIDRGACKFGAELVHIVDVGDMVKYESHLNKLSLDSRYFNEITFEDNVVVKKAITEYGNQVITNEIAYYRKIREIELQNDEKMSMAHMLYSEDNMMKLKRVQGQTVHEWLNCTMGDQDIAFSKLYDKFKIAIRSMHKIKGDFTEDEIASNINKEYKHIVFERLLKMQSIIPQIAEINGTKYSMFNFFNEFNACIDELCQRIKSFSIIHGDPNSSNVMIDGNDNFVFIDPRGKFGNLQGVYGDSLYDHAKFLYGLTGYDQFNQTKDIRFNYNHDDCSITTGDQFCAKAIAEKLDKLTSNITIKFIVGIIWLKLPYYTINNLNKSIVAYSIGVELCNHYANQLLATTLESTQLTNN